MGVLWTRLLKSSRFPCVMHLPCGDPRDAEGLEAGLRDFADACGLPLILYLKEETNFGANRDAGLDAVARMVQDGICIGIKYAVVRNDTAQDAYLEGLLQRVDRSIVVSGIGERPAIVHMEKFGLPGYTTGSGCIGSALTQQMFDLCSAGCFREAAAIRSRFLPLEDIRDSKGPARVLHAATEVAGIARCGPIPPFVSPLKTDQVSLLAEAVKHLL
jgi:dihydrodipicolinate synthase/N-acetylneuraminate lyase